MKLASLAQLVERLTRNEKVASSILAGGSLREAPGNHGLRGLLCTIICCSFRGATIRTVAAAFKKRSGPVQAAGYGLHVFFGISILLFVSDPVAGIIALMPLVFGLAGLARLLRQAARRRHRDPRPAKNDAP